MSKMVNRSKGTGTEFVNAQLIDLKDLIDYYAKKIKKPEAPTGKIVAKAFACDLWSDTYYAKCYIHPKWYWHGTSTFGESWKFVGISKPGYIYITRWNGKLYVSSSTGNTRSYGATDPTGLTRSYGSDGFQRYSRTGDRWKTCFYPCLPTELAWGEIPDSEINPELHFLKEATIIF